MLQQAISSYFAEKGHKGTLNNMMYNFYTRRVTSYKVFLHKLFPIDTCASAETENSLHISRKRNGANKALRRTIKAKKDAKQPLYIYKEDQDSFEAIENNDHEDFIMDDISSCNVRYILNKLQCVSIYALTIHGKLCI